MLACVAIYTFILGRKPVPLNPLFEATVQSNEEAIVNALVAAETMIEVDDHRVIALPHDRLAGFSN